MANASLNTGYIQTNRGIIKIAQIIMGIILSGMLCSTWYGSTYCFGDSRLSYVSSLNFVTLVINIVLFVLNLLNVAVAKLERIYAIVCTILFLIAFAFLVWFLALNGLHTGTFIAGTVLLFFMFMCHLWDLKILQGEMSNH